MGRPFGRRGAGLASDPKRVEPQDRARRAWAEVLASCALLGPFILPAVALQAKTPDMVIDDFSAPDLLSNLGTRWRGVSDQVMGGVSEASVRRDVIDGRPCLRLTGDVRLENDGGFIQAALDLAVGGQTIDASGYTGIRLTARGNDEHYGLHLRTPDNLRPWQSYRAQFVATTAWQTIELPFAAFTPYRLDTPLDVTRLRRLGLVAIGRAFSADLAVAELAIYR